MVIFHSIDNDKKKRVLFYKFEKKKQILKYFLFNKSITLNIRKILWHKLHKLPKNSSKTRVKNRCIITGRSKGVYTFFRLSRMQLKEFVGMNLIPSIRKSSW
jgi:small subunit ribosomal protein S14